MMNWPTVDTDLLAMLPPVLKAVVRALGWARARDWLKEHGGVNVHIPTYRSEVLGLDPDELMRLREVLTPHIDAAGRVWMPKADKLLQLSRNECIRRGRADESISKQARLYNLSSRQITNIRRDDGLDDGQGDLFWTESKNSGSLSTP